MNHKHTGEDPCPICASPYVNFTNFLSILTPEIMEIVMQHDDAPAYWFDGITFGFRRRGKRCKICARPELRVLVEFLMNLQVPYSKIVRLLAVYGLHLFPPNLTSHSQLHMADDLILVQIAPDRLGAGLLIPRTRLELMPHSIENNRIVISQCELGFSCCRYLVHESTDSHYCSFEYRCPVKDYLEEVIRDEKTRHDKI